MALTYKQAQEEKRRRRQPHRIVPVYKHDPLCLYSDGTILYPYPCTCGNARKVGYTLVLGR